MSSQIPLRLPKELHEDVKHLAREQGVSMNHFLVYAVTAKVAEMRHSREFFAAQTEGRTKEEAALRMQRILARVPIHGPVAEDDRVSEQGETACP